MDDHIRANDCGWECGGFGKVGLDRGDLGGGCEISGDRPAVEHEAEPLPAGEAVVSRQDGAEAKDPGGAGKDDEGPGGAKARRDERGQP